MNGTATSTLGNNAIRYSALRHPTGNTVKKTGYKITAGNREQSILFYIRLAGHFVKSR